MRTYLLACRVSGDGALLQEPWTASVHAMGEQKPFTIKNATCDDSGISNRKLYNIIFR